MIRRHTGLLDPALAQSVADLQARAYASTGMRAWDACEIASLVENPCNRLYLAFDENPKTAFPNGFMLATAIAGEAEILSLAVDPRNLRARIASRLVEAMISDSESTTIKCIILEVAETNAPALSLYTSLAFSKVGRREGYYTLNGCRADAIVLKRHVACN